MGAWRVRVVVSCGGGDDGEGEAMGDWIIGGGGGWDGGRRFG